MIEFTESPGAPIVVLIYGGIPRILLQRGRSLIENRFLFLFYLTGQLPQA